MVDFVGFSSGFNKQQDSDERRRLELANAFTAFKQANPYASPMEMQSFIDQAAAGRNYLAGGMPSGNVLNLIGERNAAALKAKQEKEASAALTSRLSQMGQVNSLIPSLAKAFDGDLTQELDGEVVASDAFKDFVSGFGLPENLSSQITPGSFEEVYRGLTTKYVDDAMRIIKNSGGNIDLDAVTSQLKVPKNLIQGFKTQVTTEQNRIKTNFELTNKKEFINQMADAMKIGPEAVENVANTMKQLGAANGFTVTPEYTNTIKSEAMRIVEQRQKEQDIADTARLNKASTDFTTAVLASPDLRNIIYGGIMESVEGGGQQLKAVNLMRNIYKQMFQDIDPALQAALEKKIPQLIDQIVGNAQVSQELKIEKKLDALEEKATGARKQILDNTQNVINLVFSSKSDKNKPLKLAAMNLGQRYYLSQATAITLASAFANLQRTNPNATSVDFEKEGQAVLEMMNAPTIDEAETTLKDNIMSEGSYDKSGKTITFEKFYTDMENKSKSALTAFGDEFDQTMRSTAQPREKLLGLKGALQKLNKYAERFNLRIANAKRNSYGEAKFLTAGTPEYDDEKVETYQKSFMENKAKLAEEIQKEIEEIENNIATSTAEIPRETMFADNEVSLRKDRLQSIKSNPEQLTTNSATGVVNNNLAKMIEEFLDIGGGIADGQDMVDILAGTDGKTVSTDDLNFFYSDPYNFMRRYNTTWFDNYIRNNPEAAQ